MIKSRVAIGYSLLFSVLGIACGDDEGGGARASCEQICERMEAPSCANTSPNCVATCREEKLNTPMDCEPELDALSKCFAGATFQCDANKVPMAAACQAKLNRWLACSGEPSLPDDDGEEPQDDGDSRPDPDEPGDDSDELVCKAAPDDDSCDTCLKGSCCEETAACGPACQRIANCIQECADDACIDTCVQDNLDGAYQFSQLGTCMVQHCAGSCELGS